MTVVELLLLKRIEKLSSERDGVYGYVIRSPGSHHRGRRTLQRIPFLPPIPYQLTEHRATYPRRRSTFGPLDLNDVVDSGSCHREFFVVKLWPRPRPLLRAQSASPLGQKPFTADAGRSSRSGNHSPTEKNFWRTIRALFLIHSSRRLRGDTPKPGMWLQGESRDQRSH